MTKQQIAILLLGASCLIVTLLVSPAPAQKAIPTAMDLPTAAQFRAAVLKNHLRRVEEYRQYSKAPKPKQDRGAKYIAQVFKSAVIDVESDWEQLADEGLKLLKNENNLMVLDATVTAIQRLGNREKKERELRKRFRKQFESQKGYSVDWWIVNELRLLELFATERRKAERTSKPPGKNSPVAPAHINRLINRTADWLGKQPDEGVNLRVVYNLIVPMDDSLKADELERLYQRCQNIPKCDPWILSMIGGMYEQNRAWEFRGTGFASSVTPEGFAGFEKHQDQASELYRKAWTTRQGFPEPAIRLIGIAYSSGDEKPPRYWFDQAITAEIDNANAYHSYMNSLLPKWGGSYDQLNDFGLECAATRRYDTGIPYHYLVAARTIQGGLPAAERVAFLSQPKIYGRIREVLLGMADDPSRVDGGDQIRQRKWCLTQLLSFAVDAEENADMVNFRLLLGDEYDPSFFGGRARAANLSIAGAFAKKSNVAGDIKKSNELIATDDLRVDVNNLRESFEILKLASECCEEPKARPFFEHYLKQRQNEIAFQSGKKLPLTFSQGLAGWIPDDNEWKVVDRNTIVGDCRAAGESAYLSLSNASLFPAPYVFEAEVKSVATPFWHFTPGLTIGPQRGSNRTETWYQPDGSEITGEVNGRLIWFSEKRKMHGMYIPDAQYVTDSMSAGLPLPKPLPKQKPREKNTHLLTAVVFEQQIFYFIDGRQSPSSSHGLITSPLGVGSCRWIRRSGKARFRNLTVRQLKSKAPWYNKPETVELYDELLEHYPHLVDAYKSRAEALYNIDRYSDALLDYKKYREVTGEVETRKIGQSLKYLGRYEEAIRVFESQLKSPEDGDRYFAACELAEIYSSAPDEKIRNGKLALEYAIIAERNESLPFGSTKIAFGRAFAELGDFEKAKTVARKSRDFIDGVNCEPMVEQLEQDEPYRFTIKASEVAGPTLKELVGKQLPKASRKIPVAVKDAGRIGEYQLDAKGVSLALVKECIGLHGAKLNKQNASKLKKSKEVVSLSGKPPSWQVYVPKDYSRDAEDGFGLLVFLNNGPSGAIPDPAYRGVLDQQRMIYISPNKAGPWAPDYYRHALAVDAVRLIRQRYRIASEDIYVAGVGCGGVSASHAMVNHSDIFQGGLPCGKTAGVLSIPHVRGGGLKLAQIFNRYVFHVGGKDPGRAAFEEIERKYVAAGYDNVKLQITDGVKTSLPDAEALEDAISFLKTKIRNEAK